MKPDAWAHYAQAPDLGCSAVYLFGGDNNDQRDSAQLTQLRLNKSVVRVQELSAEPGPAPRRHASLVLDSPRRRLVRGLGR